MVQLHPGTFARVCATFAHCTLVRAVLTALLVFVSILPLALPATTAQAATSLWLPTPPGERWRIIQGYGCGSHTGSVDRLAIDLVSLDGPTRSAPVRAAADGTIFVWVARSGTLILDHGGGFYTQYTHLEKAISTELGKHVTRGDVIGLAGSRGASPSLPHLHFNAFLADGPSAVHRRAVPLSFAEGFDLPDVGGCNQHAGQVLIASGQPGSAAAGIGFRTGAEPGHWYGDDMAVAFGGQAMARGFSIAWDQEPAGDAPAADTSDGSANLSTAGEGLHTLYVRGWDSDGKQTVASFGPIGYDRTAPAAPAPIKDDIAVSAGPATLGWQAVNDAASGVAGYRVYLGDDPNGTSDWFVPGPGIETTLSPGRYLLRVQPLDYAGNVGEWATIATVVSR